MPSGSPPCRRIKSEEISAAESMSETHQKNKKAAIFVVSAPSGAGKTTLCRIALEKLAGLTYSISYTTREPRGSEKNGVDYFFITDQAFTEKIGQGFWAEWARVHDHYYGTSKRWIREKVESGTSILLDIDVQGARQIKESFPEAATVFIMPPSLAALEARLRKRGTDAAAVIQKRLETARQEMAQKDFYDHVIVNDDLDAAASRLIAIFKAHTG